MSEYQFLYFAARDKPLSNEQLKYMRAQSTRAEVTRWHFQNEYNYGDFRGDALEMIRRGYDVHVHYANFGIRKLMFRFPFGLPISTEQFKPYKDGVGIEWTTDSTGRGGVLTIEPDGDAGSYEVEYYDFDRIIEHLPEIRRGLMGGDLRALYLGWLGCNRGSPSMTSPPVPEGLEKLPPELEVLVDFFDIKFEVGESGPE